TGTAPGTECPRKAVDTACGCLPFERSGIAGHTGKPAPPRAGKLPSAPIGNEQENAMRTGVRETATVRLVRTGALALVAVVAWTAASLGQDAAAGEQVFRRMCSPCHDIGEGAKVKLGPPLNAIDGRTAGSFEGFNYSPANKGSGITWNHDSFTKY